jgi:hypothetical protein
MTPPPYLTDALRTVSNPSLRQTYRYWLDFDLRVENSTKPMKFRRWFRSPEERHTYCLELPETTTVIDRGEEKQTWESK